jgi:cellulose synthase operon protein C
MPSSNSCDLFQALSLMIGGRVAEPVSQVNAVVDCLNEIWSDSHATGFRHPVTGHLLRQFVRERVEDYAIILRAVLAQTRDLPELTSYILDWLRGHFLANAVLRGG